MNKKILSILTGVSALAAAGLLSIIPASVSHAEGPSQAPAAVTVRTTVYVHDVHLDDFDPSNPIEEDCEFEYTYSGDAVICDMYSLWLTFSFDENNGQSFTCEGSVEADYDHSTFSQSDSINGTFRFTYGGTNYVVTGSGNLEPDVQCSNYYADFNIEEYGNFVSVPPSSSPAASGTPASPAASEDPVSPSPSGAPAAPSENPGAPASPAASDDPVSPAPSGTPAAPSENPGSPSENPGAPSEGTPADKEFYEGIDNTVNEIGLAIQGLNADGSVNENRTVEYKTNSSVSSKIITAMIKAENVTLIYTFEYKGIIFSAFITPENAAAMYSQDINWYGPCYIAQYCPTVPIGFVH